MSESRDHFGGITPQQYHAGLDKLWKSLRLTEVQDEDVFTLTAREIEWLRAIVDKLPKTSDGIPVVPGGDDVWLNDPKRGPRCCAVVGIHWRDGKPSTVDLTFHGHPSGPWDNGKLYSTRESAEAGEEKP